MQATTKAETSCLIERARVGDRRAEGLLIETLYGQLLKLAQWRCGPDDGLTATALISETWLRLRDKWGRFHNREHLLRVAALAMRQIASNDSRRSKSTKRDCSRADIALDQLPDPRVGHEATDVAELLSKLEVVHPRRAQVVELRVFGGRTIEETATALGISTSTVDNDWRAAKAWLRRELADGDAARPKSHSKTA